MRSTLASIRSSSLNQKQSKYFPQQSPKKPRQKMPTIYRHKYFDNPHFYDPSYNNYNQNPQLGLEKTIPLRKTRLDHHVQSQRLQMLMKAGQFYIFIAIRRTSYDNPQWMKVTYNYYKKSNFSPPTKNDLLEQRDTSIIGNIKKPSFVIKTRRNDDSYYKSMIKDQMSQSVELRTLSNLDSPMDRRMRSTLNWMELNQRQVSPKVGALNSRDYSIKKPLLKIGKNQFINTYSPFQKF